MCTPNLNSRLRHASALVNNPLPNPYNPDHRKATLPVKPTNNPAIQNLRRSRFAIITNPRLLPNPRP